MFEKHLWSKIGSKRHLKMHTRGIRIERYVSKKSSDYLNLGLNHNLEI